MNSVLTLFQRMGLNLCAASPTDNGNPVDWGFQWKRRWIINAELWLYTE
jgi:hypothetical protein